MNKNNASQEIKKLRSNLDLEEAHLNFEDTFEVIRDYFKSAVFKEEFASNPNISDSTKNKVGFYLEKSEDYKKIDEKARKEIDILAWQDIDSLRGDESNLLSLVTCCLMEKESYLHNVNNYMQDNFFAIVLYKSFKFSPYLGRIFREFVETHPAMQKYKVKK